MGDGHSFLLEGGDMHLSFPKFLITQPIPANKDLRVMLQPMSDDNWSIPNYILDGDNYSHDCLNHYKNRIDLLNRISKRQAVTTRANRKEQSDALKTALGLNHERDTPGDTDTGDAHDVNFDFNFNLDSSSCPKTKVLPDKYFCECSPDKLMMEALKELNINDIKDFLMAGGIK